MTAYSFSDVNATIVGPGGIVSLGNGAAPAEEGITIDMEEDKDRMVVGADGTPMHTLHAGKQGMATIRLLKQSPANALLQAMYDIQTLSSATWGINTLVVSNTAAGDIITCRSVAFRRQAPITYAKDANVNEWQFHCGAIDRVLGS
jgi:hypothetical protein